MLILKNKNKYHETHYPNTATGKLLHTGTGTSPVET